MSRHGGAGENQRGIKVIPTQQHYRASPPRKAIMAEENDIVDPLDEASEVIPFTYSISSYGADYPIDSLVKRVEAGDIIVPTFEHEELLKDDLDAFQRQYVWPRQKADRFIESLLLGLPVPGIFLVKEDSGRLLVLDGHQRLHTLSSYYLGIIHGIEYRLSGVQDRFAGKSYKELDVEDRRRLDDSIIHATIMRQEHPTEDWSSIYAIFERLNTGGVTLQAQEIRMALYHGPFAKTLRKLNTNESWRKLIGTPSKRLKDIELILRFLALLYHYNNYERPMKDFLNRYMASNRNFARQSKEAIEEIFSNTIQLILERLGSDALRPERTVNAAFADALMVGVATAIKNGETIDTGKLKKAREDLLSDKEFISSITTGTSQKPKVDLRINRSIQYVSR